jgi:hypothetical protein
MKPLLVFAAAICGTLVASSAGAGVVKDFDKVWAARAASYATQTTDAGARADQTMKVAADVLNSANADMWPSFNAYLEAVRWRAAVAARADVITQLQAEMKSKPSEAMIAAWTQEKSDELGREIGQEQTVLKALKAGREARTMSMPDYLARHENWANLRGDLEGRTAELTLVYQNLETLIAAKRAEDQRRQARWAAIGAAFAAFGESVRAQQVQAPQISPPRYTSCRALGGNGMISCYSY